MKENSINKKCALRLFSVTFLSFLGLLFSDLTSGNINKSKQQLRSATTIITNIHNVSYAERDKLVVGIIENRFIATGVIVSINKTCEKLQSFVMLIKDVAPYEDYANQGDAYKGKSVEIFSEIGIPPSFTPGYETSLVLRVSGDEHAQYLFLVKVLNDKKI